MKNNKIFSTVIGLCTFAFALALNFKHASNNYGILDSSLSMHVLAQTSGSGGSGSGSGSSSGDGSGTNSGETESYQEAKKTITKTVKVTSEAGYSWDVGLNIWLFNGKKAQKPPTHSWEVSEQIELTCCRKKGPLSSCSYEDC